MRFLWEIIMLFTFQVGAGDVPDVKVGRNHTSRGVANESLTQQSQTWLWAALLVGVGGGIGVGAYASRRCACRRIGYAPMILSNEDERSEEQQQLAESINSLSEVDIISRHKATLLLKGALGIAFRSADLLLDAIAGIKFCIAGDKWLSVIAFTIIALSPLPQFIYIKIRRGRAARAIGYLVPGSFMHVKREILQLRFIAKLPQIALFRNVHKAIGTGTLNEILAGLECAFESFPQASLQIRAYMVNGGDWVNRLSIAFSLVGVAMGVFFGLRACLSKRVQTAREGYLEDDIVLAFGAGDTADLHDIFMDEKTIEAVLWLVAEDQDLRIWNLSGNPCANDAFLSMLADHCPNLDAVYLRQCDKITDAGIHDMARKCTSLSCIDLTGCSKITDIGVKALAHMCPTLSNVSVREVLQVTDAGVKEIARNCGGLTGINLEFCRNITNDSVKELAHNCAGLTYMDLAGCHKITDDAVKELARNCKCLTFIELSQCRITSVSVKEMAENCTKLTFIDLSGTNTRDVDDEFRTRYPNLKVSRLY